MTVDEILARGWYTDRQGRMWAIAMADGRWGSTDGRYLIGGKPFSVDWMRLLIERDMHRDECGGLYGCSIHPVPKVLAYAGPEFTASKARSLVEREYDTLPEAMDAARALVVGE